MSGGADAAASSVRVVSVVPGRVRLRALAPSARASLASVAEALRTWSGVSSVRLREHSSSLVVRFDPEHGGTVADRLLALGVDVRAAGRPLAPRDPARAVSTAARSANRAVARRLGGVDLRVLVPLGLGLLSARQAMRGDDHLADAPWYVLAWYASEMFWKFHGDAVAARSRSVTSEEE